MSRLVPLLANVPVPVRNRWRLLRLAGLDTSDAGVAQGVRFWNSNVTLASGSYINRGVTFEGSGRITIESHVALGPEVLILTSTHDIGPSEWRAGEGVPRFESVTIGTGSWIGAR